MCFDSRFLNDLVATGLQIPEWATQYWNYITEVFTLWHFKMMAFGTKTPVMDVTVENSVKQFINAFPYKKNYPYQYPTDFSRPN